MSRKVLGALALTLGCGISLLGLLPKAPAVGRNARGTARHRAAAAMPSVVDAAPEARVRGELLKAPLQFEVNLGQTDERVKFLARGGGYRLFLTSTEAVVALRGSEKPAVVRMVLEGANASPRVEGAAPLEGKVNYFIGNDPTKWRTNVPTFGKVRYQAVYPGVDLLYYGSQQKLEYDFVVAPRRNPGLIRIRIGGARKMEINPAGDLVLETEAGEVKLAKPMIYQEATGKRRDVSGGFRLLGENEVGFTTGRYDTALPLVIDPTLAYSTYLGGSGVNGDGVNAIAVDSSGEAFVTGFTASADFPTAGSPFQATEPGVSNAFVTKFSSTGTSLVYSTYLGGSNLDETRGIALDSAGNAYLTGDTKSLNFPVTNASSLTGSQNAFVTKLSSSGSSLVFSTYLGGNITDFGSAIAVDAVGNAFVTGGTTSTNFPVTPGAFQTILAGASNAFAAKLNGTTGAITWATFLGGNGVDQAEAIAVDSSGNVHLTGSTTSSTFPTTSGAFQSMLGSPTASMNAFVSKLNPALSGAAELVFSTYLGGSTSDDGRAIAVDSSGDTIVAGTSTSTDFPIRGSLQSHDSVDDLFVAKFDFAGALSFSTLFGDNSGTTEANALALDTTGNIYVTGFTSALFLPTLDPLQATTVAGSGLTADTLTAFVVELKSDATDYFFSTFLGGSQLTPGSLGFGEMGRGIAVDSSGNIYVAGTAGTIDFPVDAFQSTLKSPTSNGFVTKISPATPTGPQVFPSSLNFGTVTVGSTSPTLLVTVSNGTNTLLFTSITITGANPTVFSEKDSCLPELLPRVICTIAVTADPSATGTFTATMQINDSGASSPQTVSLTVIGGTPPPPPPTGTATVSPGSLTFTSQEVSTTSASQMVTVTNTGSVPVNLAFFQPITGANPGDFSASPLFNCFPIAVSSSCTISVSFRPTAVGTRSATLQVTGNFSTSPVSVTLTGTGTPRIAVLTPTFISVGNQVIGTTSAAQVFTLMNTSSTVTLTGITVMLTQFPSTAGFVISANSCGSATAPGTLGPGLSCTISVTFTPTATGFVSATILVMDSDPAFQFASINGDGLNPAATLAPIFPKQILFGRQTVGTLSLPQSVFLQNSGNTALVFTVSFGGTNFGDFSETDTCIPSATIAPGSTCQVSVLFTPGAVGLRTGTLTINSSTTGVTGVPQTISLAGTGVTATTAAVAPTSLFFPNEPVSVSSPAQLVTFSNIGNRPLTFVPSTTCPFGPCLSGANPGDFSFTFISTFNGPATIGCSTGFSGARYNPQVACPISFTFTPTGTGTRTATFTIVDSSSNSPHTVTLMGTSGTPAPVVGLPASVNFGSVGVRVTSASMPVTLMNTGTGTLNFTGAPSLGGANAGDFKITTNTCTTTVAAGASCTVTLTFTPTLTTLENASLNFADNATPTTQSVPLSGTGLAPGVSISTALISFGNQTQGLASAAMPVTISVTAGTGTLLLTSITITPTNTSTGPSDFAQTNNCTPSVAPGATCTINVVFTPSNGANTAESANLVLSGNQAGSPKTIVLSGVGTTPTTSFTFTPAPGTGTQVTLIPGQTAQFSIVLNPSPSSSGPVTFSCGPPIPTTICTVTPSSGTLSGATPLMLVVTLQTNCDTGLLSPRGPVEMPPHVVALWMVSLLGLGAVRRWAPQTRLARVAPAVVLLMLTMSWAGCGTAASHSAVPGQPRTPAGLYTLTITATSGAAVQTISLTVRVV